MLECILAGPCYNEPFFQFPDPNADPPRSRIESMLADAPWWVLQEQTRNSEHHSVSSWAAGRRVMSTLAGATCSIPPHGHLYEVTHAVRSSKQDIRTCLLSGKGALQLIRS